MSGRCGDIPIDAERERQCREPFTWDDGVPYCDTCGLYRSTQHATALEAERQRRSLRRTLAATPPSAGPADEPATKED